MNSKPSPSEINSFVLAGNWTKLILFRFARSFIEPGLWVVSNLFKSEDTYNKEA